MLKTDTLIQLYWNFHTSVFIIVLRYPTPQMYYDVQYPYIGTPCTIF